MRYLRTAGPSLLQALQPLAPQLDACWWHIGGHGFSKTGAFLDRLRPRNLSDEQVDDLWLKWLTDYVDHDTPVGRVGKPGFFSKLADSLVFSWATHFAIEGPTMPLPTLHAVDGLTDIFFAPIPDLPPDVVLLARDVDHAYQEYGLRDDAAFNAVLDHLRASGHEASEVSDWPQA